MGRGRSPPRSIPKTAVATGNIPIKTIEWAEVIYCNANALNKGNPTTTPKATRIRGKICCCVGRFCLNAIKAMRASIAAIEALATVRNIGLNSKTATLVAGNEPLNNTTPIKPFTQPCIVFSFILLLFNADRVSVFIKRSMCEGSELARQEYVERLSLIK